MEEYAWALARIKEEGKMSGSIAERLTELAGRACYDSLIGKGRPSKGYHQHIKDVNHTSVYGHYNVTVAFDQYTPTPNVDGRGLFGSLATGCLNRPGVWLSPTPTGGRVTINLRAAYEWERYTMLLIRDNPAFTDLAEWMRVLGIALRTILHEQAPNIIDKPDVLATDGDPLLRDMGISVRCVPPETMEERWITLYISGSRGLTHELVRHGWRTGISQRSTRYCDENEAPWVEHPLITAERLSHDVAHAQLLRQTNVTYAEEVGRLMYKPTNDTLYAWLIMQGVDAQTARKQARGAARGFLGNALFTELLFSASVSQWHRILNQRTHPAADAEIRVMGARAIPVLQATRYASDFSRLELVESVDVLGPYLKSA